MKLNPGNALVLNKQFKNLLKSLENPEGPIFVTGRAGTGKSTLLQMFRKSTDKNLVVLAPTGIAALNVKGQTIHSFFGFPPKLLHPDDIVKRKWRKMYLNLDIMIIDEISMVRADMLDNIDLFLRINRESDLPFGGVKVAFFGDLFQLPPVIGTEAEKQYLTEHYETPYFFSANVFNRDYELHIEELQEVYRQTDRNFINILDNIRTRDIDYDDMEQLNDRQLDEDFDDEYYITLCTRNAQIKEINKVKLAELSSEEFTYLASVTGQFSDKLFPTNLALKLRVGAQVMFIKNDPKRRFVNGTIGKIVDLDEETIKVSVKDDKENYNIIEVEKFEWEIIKYKPDPNNPKLIKADPIGSFKQYPIKLSWAITIHKSQGKTFDRIIIDLGRGAFESGQTYVALSRCTTLDGIVLKQKLQPRDILIDPLIAEFYQNAR